MKEDDFLKHVSPLPIHDYFCFFEANSCLGPHSYSRAYINFKNDSDMCSFRERFDNYVFLDKDGHEYPAVVEQSLWHKSPTCGPFYVDTSKVTEKDEEEAPSQAMDESKTTDIETVDNSGEQVSSLWIEQDPDFFKFLEKLQSQKNYSSRLAF